ncbi:AraC family transcriptional regulator [Lysobacter arenosi]|uniref:AraC family transcriptional regulator n=1 Tax=Lysobacter arenosi TaxID=2795387 RepID=A0ABX7RE98_9GAMM|nr:AraC family transcriptional regulator [Lysobacter arenosi]QSX76015.1 AraC family transcriptional regulator [Lysobacter arenosi]
MSSLIRAATLKNYFEVAQQLGLNPQPLLRTAGLSRTMLSDPERRIPASAAVKLLEDSARQTGCDTFGLRMAESRQMSDFGVVSLLLIHQPTLRDALMTTMKYRHLLNELLAIHVEDRGRTVVIREEFVPGPGPTSRQAIELAMGALYRLCGFLLGPHWKPHSVHFTHGPPENLLVHRRVFRCATEFDREFNGIVCDAADLTYRNPSADPAMAVYVKRLVESLPTPDKNSITTDVRKDLYILMPMGPGHHRAGRARPRHERAHAAAPPRGSQRDVLRHPQFGSHRPGGPLHGEPQLLAAGGRTAVGILRAQLVHALVLGRVRHGTTGVAQGPALAQRAAKGSLMPPKPVPDAMCARDS